MSDTTVNETTESVAASQAASWAAKVNEAFEQVLVQTAAQAAERSRNAEREREEANDWHSFILEQARANAQIVNRMAQDAASVSTRITNDGANYSAALAAATSALQTRAASNGASLDGISGFDAMTNLKAAEIARDNMMAKTAMDINAVAKQAADAAVAAQTAYTGFAVGGGPMPMATAGAGQGLSQMGATVSTNALNAAQTVATAGILDNIATALGSISSSIAELNKAMAVMIVRTTGDVVVAPAK